MFAGHLPVNTILMSRPRAHVPKNYPHVYSLGAIQISFTCKHVAAARLLSNHVNVYVWGHGPLYSKYLNLTGGWDARNKTK